MSDGPKNNKRLGLIWAFVGMIILINPTVHLIDVFPDFIGAALVMIGIHSATYSIDYLKNSFWRFLALGIITLIRFGLMFALDAMDGVMKLTVAVIFAVAECVVFIPAATLLFKGLDYLTLRFSDNNDKIVGMEKAKNAAFVAFIVKECCSFLPLCAELVTTGDEVASEYAVGPTAFIRVYYVFAITVTLVFAVLFLVKLWKYFRMVDADEGSVNAVNAKVNNEINTITLNAYVARMKAALVVALIALITCASFYIDGVNFLNPALTAILLIAYFVLVFTNNRVLSCVGIVSCIGLIVVSIFSIKAEVLYAAGLYTPESYAYGVHRAVPMYEKIELFSTAQALILVFITVIAVISMRSFLKKDAERLSETVIERGREAVHRFAPSTVATGIVSTAFIVERFMMPIYNLYWIFRSLACIIAVVIFGFAVRNAFEKIYFKLRQL